MIWRFKIITKIILSRISFFRKLVESFGYFKLGNMDSFDYASKIFHFHLNEYKKIEKEGYESMLEIGPGKSIASALLGYAYGFKKIYLIDVGDFAI